MLARPRFQPDCRPPPENLTEIHVFAEACASHGRPLTLLAGSLSVCKELVTLRAPSAARGGAVMRRIRISTRDHPSTRPFAAIRSRAHRSRRLTAVVAAAAVVGLVGTATATAVPAGSQSPAHKLGSSVT